MPTDNSVNRCDKCGATLHRDPLSDELICLLCSYEPVEEISDAQIEMVPDPVIEFQRQLREEQKVNDFINGLNSSVKDLYVTKALIAINVAVFVILGFMGVNIYNPSTVDLEAWGGNFSSSTMFGEPWRLFTCMFLHGGIIHLAMNMFFFWVLGKFIEKIFGHINYLLLYIFSGLLGSLCSLIFNPHVVSVGASGALFGIFGGLAGYLFKCKKHIPPRLFHEIKSNIVMTLGLNIIFGMSVPNIDMAAHLGGLAGGFIAALVLSHDLSPSGFKTRKKRGAVFTVLAILLILASYFLIKTQFKVPIDQTFQKLDNISLLCAEAEPKTKSLIKALTKDSSIDAKKEHIHFWERMQLEWESACEELENQKPFGISNKNLKPFKKIFRLQEEKITLYIMSLKENTGRYEERILAIDKELEPFIKN